MKASASRRARLVSGLALAGALLLLGLLTPATTYANDTWPRFPTDAEIDTAFSNRVAEISCYGGSAHKSDCQVVEKQYRKMKDVNAQRTMAPSEPGFKRSDLYASFGYTHPAWGSYKGDPTFWYFERLDYQDGKGWVFNDEFAGEDKAQVQSDAANFLKDYWTDGWAADGPPPASPTATGSPSPRVTPSHAPGLCNATIHAPAGLKAGATLSPSATVTSADGTPVQGTISEVWYINGVQTNSVSWDGKPAQILLQLSCQGNAQEFSATYNGTIGPTVGAGASPAPSPTSTPRPSATPSSSPSATPSATASASTEPKSGTPGLGGVGTVPGPADPTQGLIGMIGPGLLGLLGALLLSGGSGTGGGGTGGSGGTTAPVAPGGPVGQGGKDPGGSSSMPPDSGAVPPSTQAAIDKLTYAMNQAVATKNTAMMEAISNAQANAFDANGNVIPDKYAAAVKAIREAAGLGAAPLGAAAFYDPRSSTDMAIKGMGDSWLGKEIGKGADAVVSFFSGAAHGIAQIADAAAHPTYFFRGVDTACRNVAPADSQAMDTALADGHYLDALEAGAMTYGKGYLAAKQAVDKVAGDMAWNMAKGMLPVDEVKTLFDPKASLDDKFWAFQSAQLKVGLLVVPFLGEVRGAGVAIEAARAAEAAEATSGARTAIGATRAAETAETASGARTAIGATRTAETAETASGARVAGGAAAQGAEGAQSAATAVKNIEQKVATALGDKPAPTSLAGGKRFLDQNPAVRDAIDRAIQEHGDTDAIRMARQNGEMGAVEHNLYTARRLDLQNQAMDRASQRIAKLEATRCQAAGEAVPRRVITSQASEGDRVLSGAHATTDLDRTHYASHVTHEEAEQILKEECENVGFSQESLGTHAYVAKPGTLMDTAAADTNQGAWLRNNLGGIKGRSGSVQTYVSRDGTITAGDHIGGGAGSDALPLGARSERPYLTADEMSSSAADQIPKLDKAVAANNVSDGVKYTARAVKCGTAFNGPKDALYRAAMTKDPAAQMAILKEAGIGSVAELRGMLGL